MHKMDVDFDRVAFVDSLTRISSSLEMAENHLWTLIEAWPQFAISILKGRAQVGIDKKSRTVTGSFLGKDFTITIAPVAGQGFCFMEAAVFAGTQSHCSDCLIGLFRIDHNGDVKDASGQVILSSEVDSQSCDLFVAITRKVLASQKSFQQPASGLLKS
ncbi:hypothetical protein [Pseudomonas fulva]|uniref:hypothetical protein n=1 Tax=Pseudomonas fulva TaxID=47880 RepID=UPI003F906B3C